MIAKTALTAALFAAASVAAYAQDTHSINPNGTPSQPLGASTDQSGTPNHAGASVNGTLDNGSGAAGAGGMIGADANLSALDKDSDGMISKTEAKTNKDLMKQFSKLDTNKDGKLSASEYASFEATPSGASSSTRTTR